jgi:hypothetical protein
MKQIFKLAYLSTLPWQGLLLGVINFVLGICLTVFVAYIFPEVLLFSWIAGLPSFLIAKGYFLKERWAPILTLTLNVLFLVCAVLNKDFLTIPIKDLLIYGLVYVFFMYCDIFCLKSPAYFKNQS